MVEVILTEAVSRIVRLGNRCRNVWSPSVLSIKECDQQESGKVRWYWALMSRTKMGFDSIVMTRWQWSTCTLSLVRILYT